MNSIEHRIRTGLIIALLIVFAILALLADYGVKQLGRDFVITRLQHDSDNLIKALELSPDAKLQLNSQQIPLIYQRVKSGHYFQIISGTQLIRSRSLWDRTPVVSPSPTGTNNTQLESHGDEYWLIWQQGIKIQGQFITLWIAEDIAPFEQQWRQFTIILYTTMGIALGLLVLLQRYLLRRSFVQLTSLKQAIQQLQQGEIKALSAIVPVEIQPLTDEINHLLQRLEQRINRSRSAMGNLAHELKRVLQRLYLLRDNLPKSMRPECDQALEQIRLLTERELKRARIAGSSHPGRRFTPNDDMPHLIELLQRIYPNIHLEMIIAESEELPFDRDDMIELIGNLLDNACKYGSTKASLMLSFSTQYLLIEVRDDGSGIQPAMSKQLLGRGVRIDESISGHGLGLSICKMIIDSYQGELTMNCIGDKEISGFIVTVRLPMKMK